MVAPNTPGVPGTRFTHITRRFAVLHPIWTLSAESGEPEWGWRVLLAGLPARSDALMKEATMWITYFSVVIGIALCFGIGAMAIESYEENARP